MEKGMKVTFSWRLIAAIAGTTAVAGGCLAGCGSSSPTVTVTETAASGATSASSSAANAAQPGTAGLPLGQGTFQIRGSVTEFDDNKQSIALQGTVDGLALTATGTGNGLAGGGFAGQGGYCGPFGLVGSSASGTLGGVPFTVTLSNCTSDSSYNLTATYTGNWGSRPVNVTLTENLQSEENGPSTPPTLSGTVGSQQVSGAPNIVTASGAPGQTAQISGTITVS
jgi:hypothetical protein